MENVLNAIINNGLERELICGVWGLEKENIRVDSNGKLALTQHPLGLGNKIEHPYITTDFSESQVEVITPPCKSMDEAYFMLENLHDIVTENLEKDEYLWPSSMPPIIPKDEDIPIANYGNSSEAKDKMEYRNYIAKKYGKHKQLISGIHYNFSFNEDFLKKLHVLSSVNESFYDFKNGIYLTAARNLLKHQWLLTYLLGANVATHSSYKHCCNKDRENIKEEVLFKGACSYRNSLCGYRNKEDFRVSFDTLEENIRDLKNLISQGHLRGVKEYYSPVRLKNSKDTDTFEALERDGIEYIELRMIDLNPLSKVGIFREDLSLVHLFILSSLLYPCSSYNHKEQKKAMENQNEVSFNGHNLSKELRDEGLFFFDRMEKVLDKLSIDCGYYNDIIRAAKRKLSHKEELYSYKVYNLVLNEGYINHHLSISKENKKISLNESYSLKGYEDLELSTQILLKEALLKGLRVEVLDKRENFISISNKRKIEYIKQATKTSLDSYSTALIMENKAITKKVLLKSGISVPNGGIYTGIDRALMDFNKYLKSKIVIKPNNTNFGIGITILEANFSIEQYQEGLELAFNNDDTILIEEFFKGNEYRFTIIDGKVAGILQRVPANVVGDGKSNILELIEIKNRNPLRGRGYKKPLEQLKVGSEELFYLKSKNLTPNYIPQKDEIVFLRENSNISTGGDSLDFTDLIDTSYKDEAERAAKAVGANITGVDMMIENIQNRRSDTNATIIELNFNPAIHIHCYPFKGKNRRLGLQVLNALGF
ncbi:bifunctional glutamate--cysteine ligase GshA/glutathione synthetase GshB [Thiospirochaeta perfilievii]|uniref:Glutamate--cysteine ligase n=1 Tax=Thiospirochaeta perfilievii TaxID=252967 RepID=A0A5C1Q8F4_9SPIO|nr:bifunctional glutamate--cysteine ligase GshA/glutathione synthetase GshB [Thiospirochaeta perfilievii]QEN03638.1 bifunctional glutamate--cysteine ligase GshA/glutathione synthetase GshB [Thiospirochaeta perfilievii]